MEKYLSQLLADINAIILQQWNEQTPHFYNLGDPSDPYLFPPKGWVENEEDSQKIIPGIFDEEDRIEENLEATFEEVEQFLEHSRQPGSANMLDHFQLTAEQFPPPEKLSDDQMEKLSDSIRRLWAAFNFGAVIPEDTPGKIVYPLLLKRMSEPTLLMKYGHSGIELCDYDVANCPFGSDYCHCGEDTDEYDDEDYDDEDDFFDMDELDELMEFDDDEELDDEVDWKRDPNPNPDFEDLDDEDLPF